MPKIISSELTKEIAKRVPYLGGLNVVVEVVSECLDVRYDLIPTLLRQMSGK